MQKPPKSATKAPWYEVVTNAATGGAEIVLYGYVGARDEINEKDFVRAFRQLEAAGKPVLLRLNTGGGSVFAGIPIYNAIRSSTVDTDIVVEGMAASMGSVILQAGTKRRMYKNGRVMVHKASGGAFGSAKQMRDAADLLESVEQTLADIYVERTGQSKDVVAGWLTEGKDTWFTAAEALAAGLIDEIVDAPTPAAKKKAPAAPKNELTEEQMYAHFSAALAPDADHDDSLLTPSMSVVKITAALVAAGVTATLAADANDDAVAAAITAMAADKDAEIARLKSQLGTQNTARITAALDGAVASGKILASQRDTYERVLKADLDSGLAILDGLAAKTSITSGIQRASANGDGPDTTDPRAGWGFRQYQEKDPKALDKLRNENPQLYEALKATYVKTLG